MEADLGKLWPRVGPIAHLALDVMMRRGWFAVTLTADKWVAARWYGEGEWEVVFIGDEGEYPDPFTALVEADKWYSFSVEKQGAAQA